jgi:hypothetical protein
VSRRKTANRNISFPTLNRGHVLCYVVALARGRFWARSDKEPMVRGFGIEDDSGRGGAGRATPIGGRGDPKASRRALPRFRVVDFSVWGGERPLRKRAQGAGRRTSRGAIQSVSAAVRVALGGSRKKVENFLRMSEELCSEFSAEIEERGYSGVRHSMERRVSKKLRPLKTEVESGLEAELADPRSRGWRERLRS